MSLESGRKLGLTASIIYVIVPVIIVALYGFLIFSIIAAISTTISNRGAPTIGSPFLSMGVIWIAFIGVAFISLLGLIMFIVAMYQLSHYYNEPSIFKKAIYSLVVNIVGVAALFAIVFTVIISVITSTRTNTTPASSPTLGLFIIVIFVVMFVAAIVIGIVSNLLLKQAFDKLGEKSGVHSFGTAGLLILIGVIVPIVSWIGWIFAASGFNSLKPKLNESYSAQYTVPTAPSTTVQNKYCPYCGTANNLDATYCKNCGKQL